MKTSIILVCALFVCSSFLSAKALQTSPPIDILQGLQHQASDPLKPLFDASLIAPRNAIVLIDCSSFGSARSHLYRKTKGGKLKKDKLWKGDYLRIYLANFNPYLYSKVEIDDKQMDIDYSQRSFLDNKIPSSGNEEDTSNPIVSYIEDSRNNDDELKEQLELIEDYRQAVKQLKKFIDQTHNSRNPDARLLEENKKIILQNLKDVALIEEDNSIVDDLVALFNALPAELKKSILKSFNEAAQFSKVFAAFMDLSFTLEATGVPIQIKGFDRFTFELTLSKKDGGGTFKRDYEYAIRGGVKVDQTYGLVIHGVYDEEYALKPVQLSDTTFWIKPNGEEMRDSITAITKITKREIIEDPSPSNISLGISTFTHFYWRLGPVNFGPELGVTLDIGEDNRLRYMAGMGLIFGNGAHRVSIDAGITYGKYQALSNNQAVGDLLDGNEATQINFVSKGKTTAYVGISYNIPLRDLKKEQNTK